jgi:hypothetical protein
MDNIWRDCYWGYGSWGWELGADAKEKMESEIYRQRQ